MSRKHSELKSLGFLAVMLISVAAYSTLMSVIPTVKASASYTGAAKPMEFYLHSNPTPLSLGSGYTSDSHIMNTTRLWGGTQRIGPQAGSFDIYFYVAPDLVGNWPVNGTFWLHLFTNATGATPSAVFTISVYELNADGFVDVGSWNSGSEDLSPQVYDVNAIPGNNPLKFSVPSHTFSPGSSVALKISVNPGASTAVSVWYDSALYPSRVIIYARDYARPSSVKTYAVDNSETNLFYYNWTDAQRKVIVRANVTDPLGGYDVERVNITITDPTRTRVVDNVDMVRTSDGQWFTQFADTYEANWTYASNATLGNYTAAVSVIDNNGYYRYQDTGVSFGPFIEFNDHVFQIGVIVYYSPIFVITDDMDAPLPHAQVYLTWPNGTRETMPRYTDTNGSIGLIKVLPAVYGFTIMWKDVVVKQTAIDVSSDGPYTIKTNVYQLTVQVLGNNHVAIQGAYVIAYTQAGIGYGLDTSDAAGRAVFKLPKGTYNIEAHYSAEYWLRVVTTSATNSNVEVNSSMSTTIELSEYPPGIWTTTAFWIVIALAAIAVFAAVYIIFINKKMPIARRRK
jgi:hypothetical protein